MVLLLKIRFSFSGFIGDSAWVWPLKSLLSHAFLLCLHSGFHLGLRYLQNIRRIVENSKSVACRLVFAAEAPVFQQGAGVNGML